MTFYPFATSYTERSRDLAIVTAENEALLRPIADPLDDDSSRPASIMTGAVASGPNLFELVDDSGALEAFRP